ncbi:MAG: S-adenosylmethionine decarboxylase [Candidatus Saccharimonadales bacterium]|nr:S-adenosylmethionine decarboxylase [Candidatus Saccharimonadales bacterium]
MDLQTICWQFSADSSVLNDIQQIKTTLHELAERSQLTVVEQTQHEFDPQGVSIAMVLAESHIAAHTWPEQAKGYIVLTTCRPLPQTAIDDSNQLLNQSLKCSELEVQVMP